MDGRKQFGSMILYNELLFFISCKDIFPALYKANLHTNEVECLGEVPWEDNLDENCLMEKIGNMIIIAPRWHKHKFLKYDIERSVFQIVLLDQELWINDFSVSAFSNVVRLKESLFFIGNRNGVIVEYQKSMDQFYIHNLILPGGLNREELSFFWNSAILVEGILYLPIEKGGLIKVDLENYTTNYIEFANNYKPFSMNYIEGDLWIVPYYGNEVMLYNIKLNTYSLVKIPIKKEKTPFMTAIDMGREVLLMPMFKGNVFSINKSDYIISDKKDFRLEVLGKDEGQRQFLTIYRDEGGNTYLQKSGNYELWKFNKETIFEKHSFFIPFGNIQKIFEGSKAAKRKLWFENASVSFDFFLYCIKKDEGIEKVINCNHGSDIWKLLIKKGDER